MGQSGAGWGEVGEPCRTCFYIICLIVFICIFVIVGDLLKHLLKWPEHGQTCFSFTAVYIFVCIVVDDWVL